MLNSEKRGLLEAKPREGFGYAELRFARQRSVSLKDYKPLKGDIAVMNGPPGSRNCNTGIGGLCGHIQMYNATQWVSDFFQTRPF